MNDDDQDLTAAGEELEDEEGFPEVEEFDPEAERRKFEERMARERQLVIAERLEQLELLAAYLPGVWEAGHDEGPNHFRLMCRQHLLYSGTVLAVRFGHRVTFSLVPPDLRVDGKRTPAPPGVFGVPLPWKDVNIEHFKNGRLGVVADAVLRLCEQCRTSRAELDARVESVSTEATQRIRLVRALCRAIGVDANEAKFTDNSIIVGGLRVYLQDDLSVDLVADQLDGETAIAVLKLLAARGRR